MKSIQIAKLRLLAIIRFRAMMITKSKTDWKTKERQTAKNMNFEKP